jgi:hypothetical protein
MMFESHARTIGTRIMTPNRIAEFSSGLRFSGTHGAQPAVMANCVCPPYFGVSGICYVVPFGISFETVRSPAMT